jgi:hypothetical protein
MAAEDRGAAPPLSRTRSMSRRRASCGNSWMAERTRVVHSTELQSITGLTRYDLCRQFRTMLGTSLLTATC